MNRRQFCLTAGIVALLAGCSVPKEENHDMAGYQEYYATFEDISSRTVADENGDVLWMKNDQITIFENSTIGHAFKFAGRNGSHSGTFTKVESGEYGAGEVIDGYYAVYPHSEDNTLESTGELILTFPSEQQYEEDSFGQGANLAVAASDNNHFSFKNVGGYLSFVLYGDNVSVSSITLRGNNGEKIAGDMSVTIEKGATPEFSFLTGKWNTTYTEITLVCNPAVQLGSTSAEGTAFWFVVPPIGFTGGLTFTVEDAQGNTFSKTSTTPRTITRSRRTPFNPIRVVFDVPVSSVSLNKAETTLTVGATETLTASVFPENATNKTVTWSTNNATVATVDSEGKVSALNIGTAVITATAGEKTAACTVTVIPVAVTGVTLDKEQLALKPGEVSTLTATVQPANAADKNVTWASSNAAVATVDANGKVTAVSVGTATITVTTEDGNKKATCSVTVSPIAIMSIILDKATLSLTKGGTYTLVATITPSNATDQTVTWTSSNTVVATVGSNGKVTAVAGGSATISASAGGKTATCAVTVTVPVTGVSLNKTTLSLTKGSNETLTATIAPGDATNKTVTWTSSNTSVATVDSNGKVTAVASGSATITIKTLDGNKTATCAVTVITPVTGVSLGETSMTLSGIGSIGTLTATVTPTDATNKNVTWSSSNTSVATVSNGTVTAKGAGTATITVTTVDGSKTATCMVTVTIPVTNVSLNRTTLSLMKGSTYTLTATVSPNNATDKTVTWTSSNSSVASVSSSGKVTARASGTATITAKAGSKSATCSVTVSDPISGDRAGYGEGNENEWED